MNAKGIPVSRDPQTWHGSPKQIPFKTVRGSDGQTELPRDLAVPALDAPGSDGDALPPMLTTARAQPPKRGSPECPAQMNGRCQAVCPHDGVLPGKEEGGRVTLASAGVDAGNVLREGSTWHPPPWMRRVQNRPVPVHGQSPL